MSAEKVANLRVAGHNLIYETAPEFWQDGFPTGNGHFGGLVYQPHGAVLEIAVSKLDVWQRILKIPPFIKFDRVRELAKSDQEQLNRELNTEFSVEGESQLACFKPCGRLRIEMDRWAIIDHGATIFDKRQELSLAEGCVKGSYELSGKAVSHEIVTDPSENIMAVSMSDTWRHRLLKYPYTQNIGLYRLYDPEAGEVKPGFDGGVGYIRFDFKEEFKCVMAFLVDGVSLSGQITDSHSVAADAVLDYDKSPRLINYSVYVTVVTSFDTDGDLLFAAKLKLEKAASEGFASIRKRVADYWFDFWRKSSVHFSNTSLESVWYFSLYQFASTSRGDAAPGLFGLWNADRSAPWQGDYHGDINMVMTYWPVFTLNHLELGRPFFETFDRIAKTAEAETKKYYQIDGIKFPVASGDTGKEMVPGYYRMMQCTSAFYARLYWSWYLYTRDTELLEKRIFPIIEGCVKYYLAISEIQPDGRLLIGPSWAPEQGPFPAWNTNNDLGLIKPLWKAYKEACSILKINPPHLEKVREYLEIFPEYPQKEGEFIDSLTADGFIGLNHPGLLAMVVPGNDVDADSELATTAKLTMHNYLSRTNRKSFSDRQSSACDLTWPWLLAVAVRLRDTEFAQRMLMDIGIAEFLKPNGMFAFIGGGCFRSVKEKRAAYDVDSRAPHALLSLSSNIHGRKMTMSMIEQSSAYLFAVNEMLLQSHNGIIRIFPAVPECIGPDCAFRNFLAEGAFTVSARRVNGKTDKIVVTSQMQAECRLRIYDIQDSEEIVLHAFSGNVVRPCRIAPNTWMFAGAAGEKYIWSRDNDWEDFEMPPPEKPKIRNFHNGSKKLTITYGRRGTLRNRT
ncbi:MAG: hypothetical protein NT118_02155 [Lentisphaerae bacterium]|nr:hypothetical protein [Lentisphaerota bacterium]